MSEKYSCIGKEYPKIRNLCQFVRHFESVVTKYINNVKDHKILKQSESVCCVMKKIQLESYKNNRCKTKRDYLKDKFGTIDISDDIKFLDCPIVGIGSGVLITSKHVLTCYHVIQNENLKELRIIFNFISTTNNFSKNLIDIKVRCIVAKSYSKYNDWVVLELEKEITEIDTIQVEEIKTFPDLNVVPNNRFCTTNCKVYMIGHPLGSYMMYDEGYLCDKVYRNQSYYRINVRINALLGCSGSPVFSKNSGKLIGILTCGENDFRIVDNIVVENVSTSSGKEVIQFVDEFIFSWIFTDVNEEKDEIEFQIVNKKMDDKIENPKKVVPEDLKVCPRFVKEKPDHEASKRYKENMDFYFEKLRAKYVEKYLGKWLVIDNKNKIEILKDDIGELVEFIYPPYFMVLIGYEKKKR